MKKIVWRAYFNFEKEEKWLNEMSAKGLALTDYSWCRYVFTEAPSNEYIYRIELLEHLPGHPESVAYIRFLEDSGVECVATYWRWMFLRKKSSEGSFDIYSDIQSKINHYVRVSTLFSALGVLNLIAFLINIINGIVASLKYNNNYLSYISPLVVLNGIFAFSLAGLVIGYIRKVNRLKKEKLLHE